MTVEIETTCIEPCLRLEAHSADQFTCRHLIGNMRHQVFGGQLLANALSAAMATVEDKQPKVLQAFFLRPASLSEPLEFCVDRARDGGNFSHRRVEARQSGKCVLTADVSFHRAYAGPRHQRPPSSNASPDDLEDLCNLADRFADRLPGVVIDRMRRERGVLIRPVERESGVIRPTHEPRLALWLKPALPVPGDTSYHYAALTLMSDYWIAGACDIAHSASIYDYQQPLVSLNHSVWYHVPPSVDDWILYEVECPITRDGLGIGRGLMYDRSGLMLASTAQHVLMKRSSDTLS